jgi:hypothetical protein
MVSLSGNLEMMLTRPERLLRLEALLGLIASVIGYSTLHGSWLLFALLFLGPDVALLGYLLPQRRIATALYNATHSYAGPAILALMALQWHSHFSAQLAILWIAHIAFDRLLGFGLKYPQAFKPTHIQGAAMFVEQESRIPHRSIV